MIRRRCEAQQCNVYAARATGTAVGQYYCYLGWRRFRESASNHKLVGRSKLPLPLSQPAVGSDSHCDSVAGKRLRGLAACGCIALIRKKRMSGKAVVV